VPSEIIWARICKRLRSPDIDSKESIPTAYVAWQAGTATLFDVPATATLFDVPARQAK
jgi:hypothetical protein